MLANIVAAGGYAVGDNAGLVQALKLLPVPPIGSLLMAVVQGNADLHIGGCADLLARGEDARIANISSGLGSISGVDGSSPSRPR